MNTETVEFEFLRTTQDMVYLDRLNRFKGYYRNGKFVTPIEVFECEKYGNLIIFNGNHRARAQYDLGIDEILVTVLKGPRNLGGRIKRIHEMVILPGDRGWEHYGSKLPKNTW